MGQTPLGVMYAHAPDGTIVPIQADADGNLTVVAEAGGEVVAIHAGGVAAGAYVLGSVLAGALADGAAVTIGTKADAAWDGSAPGPTVVAILKACYAKLAIIATNTTP